jgi:hypothetical protein
MMKSLFDDPEHADQLALIEEGAEARRHKVVAAERVKREEALAEVVQHVLAVQLDVEIENVKHEAASTDTDTAKAFVAWCRERGIGYLPATGEAVAAHLVELLLQDTDMARLRQVANAIIYFHEIGEKYLDQVPIRAALAFAELTHRFADGGDDGGGTAVVNDNQPSTEPLPLAAAGAAP